MTTAREQAEQLSERIAAAIPGIADDAAADAVIDAWTTWLGYVRTPPSLLALDCWDASDADASAIARLWYGSACSEWGADLERSARELGDALRAAGLPDLGEIADSTGDASVTAGEVADDVADAGSSIPWWAVALLVLGVAWAME